MVRPPSFNRRANLSSSIGRRVGNPGRGDTDRNEETFQSLLEAAKAGAEWAWERVYRQFHGPIVGYLASRGASDPEGLTGDVLFKVARGIHDFNGDAGSFRSWIFVIAHRRLIDERRSIGRRPDLTELPANPLGGDVENEAIDRLVTAELMQAFSELTDGQRDVLSLRIIGGLTLEETAQVLDVKVGAVKALQHRAIRALQQRLQPEDVTL